MNSVADHTGRKITFEYDDNKRLRGVLNSDGYLRRYTYDNEGRLLENINADGTPFVTNEFDRSGRAVKQTFPDGGTMSYAYDDELKKTACFKGG